LVNQWIVLSREVNKKSYYIKDVKIECVDSRQECGKNLRQLDNKISMSHVNEPLKVYNSTPHSIDFVFTKNRKS